MGGRLMKKELSFPALLERFFMQRLMAQPPFAILGEVPRFDEAVISFRNRSLRKVLV
jgi:hypothetical protein